MTTHGNPLGPIGLFVEAANLAEELRKLCRHVDDDGAADYVRLAGEDPMDHDPHAKPVLAVPVSEIEALLERMIPVRFITFDEVTQFTRGGIGGGKSNILGALIDRMIALGRKPGLPGLNEPGTTDPDRT